jgi:acetate---CoA ligase (ADP-forming)
MEKILKDSLYRILNPKSVAVIGISRNKDSFSNQIVSITKECGYKGKLYLINPNADYILDLKCYPSVLDVPGEIDVAVLMVPKETADASIEECIKKGVKGIVIISGGFGERDSKGKKHQDEIVKQANKKGIRIIGPNTLGYYSAPVDLNIIQSGFIKKGDIALITQSGNISQSITFSGTERGLGFSYVVDLGNQADLQFHDLIRFFREDKNTNIIALHIEGLRNGRKFIEEVRETVKIKPVVVLKGGRTERSAKIISSHTGAIAGDDEIYTAAFRQCGAIQVESILEFISVLLVLDQKKAARGNRISIMSEGGGDLAITSDACIKKNLVVPELSAKTQGLLKNVIPENGSVINPVDLAGWESVVESSEIILEDESINGLIIVGGFAGFFNISPGELEKEEDIVRRMCKLISKTKKPVIIYSCFSPKKSKTFKILEDNEVPLFIDHHDAVNAMAALVKYDEFKSRMTGRSFLSEPDIYSGAESFKNEDNTNKIILEPFVKQILKEYNILSPQEKIAKNKNEAVKFAEEIGYPVSLKIVSKDIIHKSDAGCVKLGLVGSNEIGMAFDDIMNNAKRFDKNADIAGILISKMDTEEGVEIIIGGLNDPVFGPVIMFGIGGIFVEMLKDVSFRICPIDEIDADEMVREIRCFPILTGIRGKTPVDLKSIKKTLINVSRLLIENPQILQLDLNPIKVHKEGLLVLDANLILK